MAKISVNTTDEKYQGIVEEGSYRGRCTEVQMRPVASDPGKNQLMWSFESSYNGKEVEFVRFTPLSGKGVVFTRQILDALRVSYDEVGDSVTFESDDCMGKECGMKIVPGVNPRTGLPQNSIEAIFAV